MKHLRIPPGLGIQIYLGELPDIYSPHSSDPEKIEDAVVIVLTMNGQWAAEITTQRGMLAGSFEEEVQKAIDMLVDRGAPEQTRADRLSGPRLVE